MHQTLVLIFSVLMCVGLVGVILPVWPGVPFLFGLAVIFGFLTHFTTLTLLELAVLGVITIVSMAVDYTAGALGARLSGASARAAWFGLLGTLIGLFLFPPLGAFVGLFVGVLGGELMRQKDVNQALKAAHGSLLGAVAGIMINLVLALIFIACFTVFGWQ